MVVLQVNESPVLVANGADQLIAQLAPDASLEEELDSMVAALKLLDASAPDQIMSICMASMARCTEIYLQLVRIEGVHRKARVFRTTQLQKVMDLLDFEFKGASRLIEVRRQEVELTRGS
jgi:hypothetical protein